MKTLIVLFVAAAIGMSAAVGQGSGGKAAKEVKPVLKTVSCAPECGFMVRSHDEKEVSAIVIDHAKKYHNKVMTEKDVKDVMKSEAEPPMKSEQKKY